MGENLVQYRYPVKRAFEGVLAKKTEADDLWQTRKVQSS